MAMLRNTLRLDYTPGVEAVAEYAEAAQAEAELMSVSGGDDPKKRLKLLIFVYTKQPSAKKRTFGGARWLSNQLGHA